MLVKRNMQIPMDFECFGWGMKHRLGMLWGLQSSCLTSFYYIDFFAAPVASAEAKMLLSGAPESNQRAPRGGCRMSSLGDSPLWTPPPLMFIGGKSGGGYPACALSSNCPLTELLGTSCACRRLIPHSEFRIANCSLLIAKGAPPPPCGIGCALLAFNQPSGLMSVISKNSAVSLPLTLSTFSSSSSVTCWSTMRAPAVM